MSGHSTAEKEIYHRKVLVCERVAEANGAATGDFAIGPHECNDALIAAGLPIIQTWTEWFSILYGPQPADPVARELKRLAKAELLDIAFAAMDGNKKKGYGGTAGKVFAIVLRRILLSRQHRPDGTSRYV